MTNEQKDALAAYFDSLKDLDAEAIMSKISEHLDDEAIEIFVDHIEDFYGIEDDEQLGMLTQLMVSGYVAAKEIN